MSLHELIAPVSHRLTPAERRISALLAQDATLLAFGTVSDLATRAGTSRPSIVRFATKLGFDGFTSLQEWARKDLARLLTTPGGRIRQKGGDAAVRSALEDAIRHTLDTLDDRRLESLAAPIARARAVWIISGETSMAGATVLHSGLSMLRRAVHLVHEQSAARQLSSARPGAVRANKARGASGGGDVAVVFDFARYRRHSVLAARALADLGITIVAITDGPLSPLASLSKTWCQLRIPAAGPFDSALPAVLTSELITARVARILGPKARAHIDRLEQLWQRTGTFLEYVPRSEKNSASRH